MEKEEGIVRLSLEKAREYFNGDNEALKEIAMQAYDVSMLQNDSWENLFIGKEMGGYYITSDSIITAINPTRHMCKCDKNMFKTLKQAQSALAYSQLTQLMALPEYNGDWVPDWMDESSSNRKSVILCSNNCIYPSDSCLEKYKIAFKSESIRDKFLKNFGSLLKQYFEID